MNTLIRNLPVDLETFHRNSKKWQKWQIIIESECDWLSKNTKPVLQAYIYLFQFFFEGGMLTCMTGIFGVNSQKLSSFCASFKLLC